MAYIGSNKTLALNSQPGKSAYEIALMHGFKGTEEEWLKTLKGDPGDVDLKNRLTPLDGIIEVEFEQGSFNNTTGVETNSNYDIRSKEYIKISDIESISVNSAYKYRLYCYDENKQFVCMSAFGSIQPTKSGCHYARVRISGVEYIPITPNVEHGFNLTTTLKGVNEKIAEVDARITEECSALNERIDEALGGCDIAVSSIYTSLDNTACDITIEQGSITHANGTNVNSSTYIRTAQFIPFDLAYKISANNGYEVKVFYYDDNKALIEYRGKKYTTLSSGFGEYEIPYVSNAKWVRFSIQNESKTTIDVSADTGFKVYGLSRYRREQHLSRYDRNIVEQLKPQYPIVTACWGKTIEFYNTDFRAICVTDLHGKFTALDDAYAVQQYWQTKHHYTVLPILNLGDNVAGKTKENGSIVSVYNTYIEKAIQYGVYHTIGQHEVGFYDTESGRSKDNCLTHDEVFEKFIAPMKEVWELPDLTTNYYFKDFASQKVRLISLYQYNVPLVEETSTVWRYWRAAVWYGQDQLNWFVDTLNSTPDGYRVIVLMHQPEVAIKNTENTTFFNGTSLGGGNIIDGTPIVDIVEAYRNRTSLNKTYTCKDKSKYPESDFSNTVNADFTNAKGKFANYYTGDAHVDYFGTVGETTQKNLGITSSGQSYDCVLRNSIGDDGRMASVGNNLESTLLTVVGYDHNKSLIRIGRLGQQFASNGQIRMYTAIKY